mgnify:FL=1
MDGKPNPSVTSRKENGQLIVTPAGDWTIESVGELVREMRKIERANDHGKTVLDLSQLGKLDTAGAFLLSRSVYQCRTPDADWHFRGYHATARELLGDVVQNSGECVPDVNTSRFGFVRAAERIGVGLEGA